MKKLILLLLCLFACGAPNDDDFLTEEPLEYGQVEQAIFLDDGYGVDLAQNRCWLADGPGWAGGRCRVPDAKGFTVHWNMAGCSAPQVIKDGLNDGLVAARNWINSIGHSWGMVLSLGTGLGTTTPYMETEVACVAATGGNPLMATALPESCFAGVQCEGNSPRILMQYKTFPLDVRVWYNEIQNRPNWAGKTTTQRRRFVRNAMFHEVMHIAGLGHDTCDETPLMCGAHNGMFDNNYFPTDYEKSLLQRYNHTSGTNPH